MMTVIELGYRERVTNVYCYIHCESCFRSKDGKQYSIRIRPYGN